MMDKPKRGCPLAVLEGKSLFRKSIQPKRTSGQDILYREYKKERNRARMHAYTRIYARIGKLGLSCPGCPKGNFMLEKMIEMHLVKAVKEMGGRAVKFMCPGLDGMPDRLVLLPKGKVGFVEVKAPGMKPRPLQKARIEMLQALGVRVYVLDSLEMIGEILNDIYTA